MENIVKTFTTTQTNLKPLTKMVGMYGYAERLKYNLKIDGIELSLFVIYRAIEGTSKNEHSNIIRSKFLDMVFELKDSVCTVEKRAEMLLN